MQGRCHVWAWLSEFSGVLQRCWPSLSEFSDVLQSCWPCLSEFSGILQSCWPWLSEFSSVVQSCFTRCSSTISTDASFTKPEDSLNQLFEAILYSVSMSQETYELGGNVPHDVTGGISFILKPTTVK